MVVVSFYFVTFTELNQKLCFQRFILIHVLLSWCKRGVGHWIESLLTIKAQIKFKTEFLN